MQKIYADKELEQYHKTAVRDQSAAENVEPAATQIMEQRDGSGDDNSVRTDDGKGKAQEPVSTQDDTDIKNV